VFALTLVIAPLLYQVIGMGGIFALTGILSLLAILVVVYVVPPAPMMAAVTTAQPITLREVLHNRELMRLNFGVFALHMMQMAMFVVVPAALVQALGMPLAEHWKI
jgi:hypothetical protein